VAHRLQGRPRESTANLMPALFPSWTNTGLRLVLAGVGTSVVAVLVGLMVYVRTPWNTQEFRAVDQPVQFDHRHHVVDDEIPCLYCHRGAEVSNAARVPASDVCMGCHAQIWSDSPLLEPVRRSYFSGEPLRWNAVHRLPDFVYFNHAVHVQGGIGCVACHGRVQNMARVYKVVPLTMDWCLDCHRAASTKTSAERAASSDFSALWGDSTVTFDPSHASRAVTPLTTCTACHR
jgi:hypothetical protein